MAESVLVNRKKFISSLTNKIGWSFTECAPQKDFVFQKSRLDECTEDLLKKYEKKDG